MTRTRSLQTRVWVALLAITLLAPNALAKERSRLVNAVPSDVFLCVSGQHNPERAFLDDYWGGVFDALKQSDVGPDLMALVGSLMGEKQVAEVQRLRTLATQLLDGVDWKALGGGEIVFAERLNSPLQIGTNLSISPPDMVFLARGVDKSAASNYDGLVTILKTMAAEINQAAGEEALAVETKENRGAKIAGMNLLKAVKDAPSLALAVILRDDVIAITFGDRMQTDVLDLMEGSGSAQPLAATSRYQGAFTGLPKAEDNQTFFDVQALLRFYRDMVDVAIDEVGAKPEDTIVNAYGNKKANEIAERGVEAYRQQDFAQALELTKQAHEIAPTDSRLMYNLACFSALTDKEEEALTWLDKAVDAGFRAPEQIAHDSDLLSLQGHARFEAAVARAKKHAADKGLQNAKMWKGLATRLLDAPGMVDYVASVEYTDGYAAYTDQIVALVPGAADKPLYSVFGKRTPIAEFDRFLPEETVSFSIDSGIDLEALYSFVIETLASMGEKGTELLAQWDGVQDRTGFNLRRDLLSWIDGQTISVEMAGPNGAGSVLMIKVNDAETASARLASSLTSLSKGLHDLAQKNPMLAMLSLRTEPSTDGQLAGFHNVFIGMSPEPAVCGVTKGYLFLSSSADAVKTCLATAAGEHPNVTKNEQLMSELLVPNGPFRSLSLADKRSLGDNIAKGIGLASMMGGGMMMAIPDPEARQVLVKVLGMVSKLGPIARKIDFYKSTSSCTTFDSKGWHSRSVTNYRTPAERVASHGNTASAPPK